MDEVARRRIAALLLVAGAIVAALAIADLGPFDDPPTVEEEVRGSVESFFTAASDGDAGDFCDLLTEEARNTLRVRIAALSGEDEPPGCQQAFEVLRKSLEGSELTVRHVSVSGNRARVEGRFRAADSGAQPRTIELLEEKGDWRISDPG